MARIDYNPAPGQQMPSKYQFTGANYSRYGEQPGYVYHPWTDQYYADPKAMQKQYENQGLIEKPPGLGEQLLPVAAGSGALYLGKQIGSTLGEKGFSGLASQAKGLLGLGESTGTTAATSAAQSTGATVGANTASQTLGYGGNTAGFMGSEFAPSQAGNAAKMGPGGLLEIGSTAGNIAGGVGLGLGAYGAYEGIKNKDPLTAGLGGGSAVLGLNQLGYTLGPWGVAASIAVPAALALFNKLGDKDEWKNEQKRMNKFAEEGRYIPPNLLQELNSIEKGRSKEELIRIEEQNKAAGKHSNLDFARTRDEKYLTPVDIVNYSAFVEKDPDWFKRPLEERLNTAKQALDAGAVNEAKGQIKIDWKKVNPPQGLLGVGTNGSA